MSISNKKITLNISEELLAKAREATGGGITDTVRRGLQLLAASSSYDELRSLRGKLKLSIDVEALREDRNW